MTLEQMYENIDQGVYGPDRGLVDVLCKVIRGETTNPTPGFMHEFYASAEAGWARFEQDALVALGITNDPHAKVLFAAAAVVGGGQEDLMKTFAMLRRMAVVLAVNQEAEPEQSEESRRELQELREQWEQLEKELEELEKEEQEWQEEQRKLLDLDGPPSIMPCISGLQKSD